MEVFGICRQLHPCQTGCLLWNNALLCCINWSGMPLLSRLMNMQATFSSPLARSINTINVRLLCDHHLNGRIRNNLCAVNSKEKFIQRRRMKKTFAPGFTLLQRPARHSSISKCGSVPGRLCKIFPCLGLSQLHQKVSTVHKRKGIALPFVEHMFVKHADPSPLCRFASTFSKEMATNSMPWKKQRKSVTECLLNECVAPFHIYRWASTSTTRDRARSKLHSKLSELREEELVESFVRGSGPGGQATNKTSNCVVLKHVPTGIVVKCHQTRSQSENKKIARLLLREKLDVHYRGENSALTQHQQSMHKKREEKKRKTRRKLEKLRELKLSGSEDSAF